MLDLLLVTLQIINVTATEPCFLNFTAGPEMWQNCGASTDWLTFMLLPWEWISGGYFSMIFVSLMVAFTYIKYHKAIYPLMIGIAYLPISFYLFPNQLIIVPFLLVGALIGVFIYSMLMHRTKEYNG